MVATNPSIPRLPQRSLTCPSPSRSLRASHPPSYQAADTYALSATKTNRDILRPYPDRNMPNLKLETLKFRKHTLLSRVPVFWKSTDTVLNQANPTDHSPHHTDGTSRAEIRDSEHCITSATFLPSVTSEKHCSPTLGLELTRGSSSKLGHKQGPSQLLPGDCAETAKV